MPEFISQILVKNYNEGRRLAKTFRNSWAFICAKTVFENERKKYYYLRQNYQVANRECDISAHNFLDQTLHLADAVVRMALAAYTFPASGGDLYPFSLAWVTGATAS